MAKPTTKVPAKGTPKATAGKPKPVMPTKKGCK